MHQSPTHGGSHQDFVAARLAMSIRILPRLVDVEFMVRVLDQRHGDSLRDKPGHKTFDERCLAATGPAGESKDLHREAWRPARAMQKVLLELRSDGKEAPRCARDRACLSCRSS